MGARMGGAEPGVPGRACPAASADAGGVAAVVPRASHCRLILSHKHQRAHGMKCIIRAHKVRGRQTNAPRRDLA